MPTQNKMAVQDSRLEILDNNFCCVIEALNSSSVPYWVCHGSLLGLVRDGRLIEWDHDIDIAVFQSEVERDSIEKLMLSLGFEKGFSENDLTEVGSLHFRRDGGRFVDFNFYLKPFEGGNKTDKCAVLWALPNFINKVISAASGKSIGQKNYKITRFILRLLAPIIIVFVDILHLEDSPSMLTGYAVPCDFLKSFEEIEVGGIQCRIPLDSEGLCEYIYGADWRVPRQAFNWVKDANATVKS